MLYLKTFVMGLSPSSSLLRRLQSITDAKLMQINAEVAFASSAEGDKPMAGRLDLKGHFDPDEDLGISRGYKDFLDM